MADHITSGITHEEPENSVRSLRKKVLPNTSNQALPNEEINSSNETLFDDDALRIYAGNQVSLALWIPLLAAVVAYTTTIWISLTSAVLWLSMIMVTGGILLSLSQQYLNNAQKNRTTATWQSIFMCAEFLHSTCWAVLAFVPTVANGVVVYDFILAALIVVMGVRTMLAGAINKVLFAATMPIASALVLRFTSFNDAFYYAMAAIAIFAQGYFVLLGRKMRDNVYEMLKLRAQKDNLITNLERTAAVATDARRRAESASLAKSRFLATMSHELRTPLNAILGFSEIMKNELFGKHTAEAYKEYSNDIHDSGAHLLNVINEILDISRIEAGKYDLNEEAVNLVALAEDCQRLVALKAREKSISLEDNFEDQMPDIWVDARAIRQVIINLLSNALKFTPHGGTITMRVGYTRGGGQYVAIRDNGRGVPKDEIPTILTAFGQGSEAVRSAEQGSGLGLPIVKGLVDLHNGSFDFQSEVNVGTQVIFTLPSNRVLPANHNHRSRRSA